MRLLEQRATGLIQWGDRAAIPVAWFDPTDRPDLHAALAAARRTASLDRIEARVGVEPSGVPDECARVLVPIAVPAPVAEPVGVSARPARWVGDWPAWLVPTATREETGPVRTVVHYQVPRDRVVVGVLAQTGVLWISWASHEDGAQAALDAGVPITVPTSRLLDDLERIGMLMPLGRDAR